MWTKACGQVTAASLAIWPRSPPHGPRGGGAAVAVLDTYLHTLLKKNFFKFVGNVTQFTEFQKTTCTPSST